MKISLGWLKELIEIGDNDITRITKLFSNIGLEVEGISERDGDAIIDVEITPQRPDLLGMWGVARELAIFIDKRVTFPNYNVFRSLTDYITVKIKDPSLCGRYTCGILRNIKSADTPAWIKDRLISMDSIPQDTIVDIGNYVMFETGQPVHIFDLDRIKDKIIVRKSKRGDTITTLDGIYRELPDDILLICDGEIPIAIAGIMGGMDSMVTVATKNVLVESAYFDPKIIRKGGKKLGISTEASYRFERGGDIEITDISLFRVMTLLVDHYGAEPLGIIDGYPSKYKGNRIRISEESVNRVLGSSLSEDEVNSFIKKLNFEIKNGYVYIPSYRRDILSEIDLIEEIARLIGYDNFPPETPPIHTLETDTTFINKIKSAMVALGFNEAYTIPLVKDGKIKIANYMRDDMCSLRSNIMDGLLSVINHNTSYGTRNMRIFEIGKVFNSDDEITEHDELSAVITGERSRNPLWSSGNLDFSDIKGVLEGLFEIINITGWEIEYIKTENYEPGCVIRQDNRIVGYVGKIKREKLKEYDIDFPLYGFEIDIAKLKSRPERHYKPVPRFPGIERDLSIIVSKDVSTGSIFEFVKERSPDILEELSIFDYYKGKGIPEDKVSVGLRLYFRRKERTLTKGEVDSIVTSITNALINEYKASLRTI